MPQVTKDDFRTLHKLVARDAGDRSSSTAGLAPLKTLARMLQANVS